MSSPEADPLVSVLIPTIHRSRLVTRAVRSALGQTVGNIEVIAVVDGPDDATRRALDEIQDRRLRVLALPHNVGLGGAVNAGVEEARGCWIALLDDDDEWLPSKLEIQLDQAQRSECPDPIICCRFIARTEVGDLVWPRRYPASSEALSEYLFCQHGVRGGEGAVLPSSVLTTRALLQRVPWRGGLPRLNDFDWLMRVVGAGGVRLEFVPWDEPLVIYHREESRNRMSTSGDWRYCRAWVQVNRHLVSRRAYAGFMLTIASTTAARARERKAFWVLLWDACRNGKPSYADILAHVVIWLIPWKLRTRIAITLDRGRRVAPGGRKGTHPLEGSAGIPSERESQFGPVWSGAEALDGDAFELCRTILLGAPGVCVTELRKERGKRTFRAQVYSGTAIERVVVKEFGSRGPVDAVLLRHLRPGPGRRYAHAAAAIRDTGVLTAPVRFAVSGRGPDGPRYLIGTREIEAAQTLGEVLTWLSPPERADLFETIGQAAARLHRAGIFHFDLNEDNLLFRVDHDVVEGPYVVDLDYTVRVPVRRRWLCRVLARLDLHQFFTIRNAELTNEDRRLFGSGCRLAERPGQPARWRIVLKEEQDSGQAKRARVGQAGHRPWRNRYPRWKRVVGTSLIHLLRGILLVCRVVR